MKKNSDKIRDVQLTNTLSGQKELLKVLVPGKLSFYSCGPTVYNLIHIGNLRAALVSDLFYRYFKTIGYEVNFVRNYTDVDDRIIKQSQIEGVPASEIAKKYIQEVEKDYAMVGMLEPTHKTMVTTHIQEIIQLIEKIIQKGHAYVVEGEVLFSISSFPSYGKLSHKNIDELQMVTRVDVNEKKKSILDFTLWKPAKPGEPSWESPWGPGRPGWHIECSAMSSRWLGDQIDVHHGGEDLVFPHHENEIAQSEAASDRVPFVGVWLHSAFLLLSKEKMSKSLGNVITARDFLTQFGPEVTRYLLLSVHYRSLIDFKEDSLENALIALHRIYEAKKNALELIKNHTQKSSHTDLWQAFIKENEHVRQVIHDQFANDFNTPGVFAALFGLIRDFNRILAESKKEGGNEAAKDFIQTLEDDVGNILGIGKGDPNYLLKEIERIRALRPTASGASRPDEKEILAAITARTLARQDKNFAEADRIRKDLLSRGVVIKDGPTGTTWEYQ